MHDSKLFQESNLAARQPHGAPHQVIRATTSEGLAQGPEWVRTSDLPHRTPLKPSPILSKWSGVWNDDLGS